MVETLTYTLNITVVLDCPRNCHILFSWPLSNNVLFLTHQQFVDTKNSNMKTFWSLCSWTRNDSIKDLSICKWTKNGPLIKEIQKIYGKNLDLAIDDPSIFTLSNLLEKVSRATHLGSWFLWDIFSAYILHCSLK